MAGSADKSHTFKVATFHKGTHCAICSKFIWGAMRQGVACTVCGMPAHHRCAESALHDCRRPRQHSDSSRDGPSPSHSAGDGDGEEEEEEPEAPPEAAPPIRRPHSFVTVTLTSWHYCELCHDSILGMVKQGVRCEVCDRVFHKRCQDKVPDDCMSILPIPPVHPEPGGEEDEEDEKEEEKEPGRKEEEPGGKEEEPGGKEEEPGRKEEEEEEEPLPEGELPSGGEVDVPGEQGLADNHDHVFITVTLTKFTDCALCKKFIWGPALQGKRCKHCHIAAHHRCAAAIDHAQEERVAQRAAEASEAKRLAEERAAAEAAARAQAEEEEEEEPEESPPETAVATSPADIEVIDPKPEKEKEQEQEQETERKQEPTGRCHCVII